MASSTAALDTSAFSDPNFDVKGWINATLKSRHPNNSTASTTSNSHALPSEQDVTILATRLQLSSEQVSRKVGQTTDSVLKSMPRMLYDIKLITDDAQAAKRGIDQVRVHLDSTHNDDTETALSKLEQLHIVKTRMEKCCSALKEAENWSNLEAEATRVLENQDYEGAANRLENAQQSLNVFQHSPEYSRRKELLRRLQQQLEDALRPKATEALGSHDAVECFKYYKVFGKMGRADYFVDLYFEVRNPLILNKWKKKQQEEYGEDDDDAHWIASLDSFYKTIFESLSEEYIWSASIFPDPKPVVQAQVQSILQSLDPSIADRLASIATHQGTKALPSLVSAFVATESFGMSLERLFSKPPVNTASASDHTAASLESLKTRTRRRSSVSQLSLVPLTLRHADTNAWSYVLYVPFLPFQSQYATLESRYLNEQLVDVFEEFNTSKSAIGSGGGPLAEALQQTTLTHVVAQIYALANESLTRCMKFTHGFGAVEWIRALNGYMNEIKRRLSNVIRKMQKQQQPRITDTVEENGSGSGSHGDWPAFQMELRLLGMCQALDAQLRSFEEIICQKLESTRSLIQEKDQDDNPLLSPVTPSVLSFTDRSSSTSSSDIREHRRRSSFGGNAHNFESRHERKRSTSSSITEPPSSQHSIYPRSSMALLRTSRLNSHELQRVIGQVSTLNEQDSVVTVMLKDAHQAIYDLTAECQVMLHKAILGPIIQHLDTIPTLRSVWTAPEPQSRRKNVQDATIHADMPQFSLSPNAYITRIGEKLLMLPQEFEVYADDSSLRYHIESAPFIEKSDLTAQDEEEDRLDSNEEQQQQQHQQEQSGNDEEEEEEEEGSDVIQLWTTSVARGTMARFLDEIRKIQKTTPQGQRQLRTDIEYLVNVLSALDVQPLPDLVEFHSTLSK
ncbi:hypothetical protein O0I10_006863 [Lichtheimia ornata]|uniref:Conserved oligomeric Golgi complex subunit 7 n=1 Tax=Lichtheimia ornata TaxID=688661 RepID=A0AAD7V1X7_9FUNG|nr:uncharacterized protein O0I10_006863 [Lichtheimia ornata]KAJ8657310.1 hypothetical protein O0I10_006863 [Lichtheimia ornata]